MSRAADLERIRRLNEQSRRAAGFRALALALAAMGLLALYRLRYGRET